MTKQITTKTANTSGIAAVQVISSASEIADRTTNATAITNNSEVLQEVRTFMEGLNQSDSLRGVDYTKFSAGTNQLDIVADAITWWDKSVYDADKSADADLTGWPAITLPSLTNDTDYYIWATFVSGTKSYEARPTTSALPSDIDEKAMVAHISVNGSGAITITETWQGPDQNVAHYWKKEQTFLDGVDIRGGITTDSITISGGNLPAGYHDIQIDYVNTSSVKILADSRVRSSDDSIDIVFSSDVTASLGSSGANGLDTGSVGNSMYYLYAIYNEDSSTSALLWSVTNEANTGSVTLPSGYTKKRQLNFGIRRAGGNLLAFEYSAQGRVELSSPSRDVSPYALVNNGAVGGTFTNIDCSAIVPAIGKRIIASFATAGGLGNKNEIRVSGSAGTGILLGSENTVDVVLAGHYEIALVSGVYQYRNTAGSVDHWCVGYYCEV